MAKYYYEAGGEVHEIEMTAKEAKSLRASNPHLTVKTSKQATAQQKADAAKSRKRNEAIAGRKREYPPVTDQLDAIMKWAFTETEIGLPAELVSLAAKCMSVKSKHPLP